MVPHSEIAADIRIRILIYRIVLPPFFLFIQS
jgi:hypothetical protein